MPALVRPALLPAARLVAFVLALAALTACGDDAPKPARPIEAPQEAMVRDGDLTIRAHLVPTQGLSEAMARQYGLPRDENTRMLLVSLRREVEGQEVNGEPTQVSARITATVTDLRGVRRPLEMRELRTPGATDDPSQALVDHAALVTVSPPDTLRFDLKIVRADGRTSTMTFSRDLPRP